MPLPPRTPLSPATRPSCAIQIEKAPDANERVGHPGAFLAQGQRLIPAMRESFLQQPLHALVVHRADSLAATIAGHQLITPDGAGRILKRVDQDAQRKAAIRQVIELQDAAEERG